MARYRKKPVEVDAWQVGSDEPMPKWARPENYPCIYDGCWLVHEVTEKGVHRVCWYHPGEFEQTYEAVE